LGWWLILVTIQFQDKNFGIKFWRNKSELGIDINMKIVLCDVKNKSLQVAYPEFRRWVQKMVVNRGDQQDFQFMVTFSKLNQLSPNYLQKLKNEETSRLVVVSCSGKAWINGKNSELPWRTGQSSLGRLRVNWSELIPLNYFLGDFESVCSIWDQMVEYWRCLSSIYSRI
jgi:hypothetical protein